MPLGLYLLASVDDDEVDILRFLDGDFGGLGLAAAAVDVVAGSYGDGNLFTCLSTSKAFFISLMFVRSSCASSFPQKVALISVGILSKRQK